MRQTASIGARSAGAWRQAAALAGSGIVSCIALYLLQRGLDGRAGWSSNLCIAIEEAWVTPALLQAALASC